MATGVETVDARVLQCGRKVWGTWRTVGGSW